MKVVINTCFGGFSLSPLALQRCAELKGRKCYFFNDGIGKPYRPLTLEEATKKRLFFSAFDVPDVTPELAEDNEWYKKHTLYSGDTERTDPHLIQVIEELGDKANGACATLRVVEIPDGVEWEIAEYDGNEHVAEKHRTWR